MESTFYARLFCSSRWVSKSKDLLGINGEAITTDLRADANEWSVYQCGPSFSFENDEIDRLAIQMALPLLSRIKFPLTILFFEQEFIEQGLGKVVPDPSRALVVDFGYPHYEIQTVHYKEIAFLSKEVYTLLNETAPSNSMTFREYEHEDFLKILLKHWNDILPKLKTITSEKELNKYVSLFQTLTKGYKKVQDYDVFVEDIQKIISQLPMAKRMM